MSSEETNRDGGSQGLPEVTEADRRSEPHFALDSYGTRKAIKSLPPECIREVFKGMPDNQVHDLVEDIQLTIDDLSADPESHEGAIKDLAHKRSILLDMVGEK
jgi:hypothetical protein